MRSKREHPPMRRPPPKQASRLRYLGPRTPEDADVDDYVISEDEDEGFDRRPDQAGPSRYAHASPDSDRIRLDGMSDYPWHEVRAFLPEWLPEHVWDYLTVRMDKRDMMCTKNPDKADVIFMYHGMTPEHAAQVEAWKRGAKDRIVASTDWFARVYFTGKAHPVPRSSPVFVDGDGRSLLVCVPDLGDDKLRRQVMYHLECNGAIVVALGAANTIILPNGHKYIRKPLEQYKKLRRYEVDWVFAKVAEALERRRTASSSAAPPTQKQTIQRKRGRAEADTAMPPPAKPQQPATSRRNPFTAEDRDRLARWLAFVRPIDEGRLSQALYDRLLKYGPDDPVYGWAARHTPSAWREHYKKNRYTPWKDMTVLENMIQFNVRHGVDGNLTLETERPKTAKRAKRRSARVPHAPKVPTDDKEDSLDAREVDGALLA